MLCHIGYIWIYNKYTRNIKELLYKCVIPGADLKLVDARIHHIEKSSSSQRF